MSLSRRPIVRNFARNVLAVASLMLAFTVPASAGDAAAGKTKAAVCAACHGVAGVSATELWPNLAGQKETYLAKQLAAFRDGKRVEPTMAPFVANLSDADIADISAFYASLTACP